MTKGLGSRPAGLVSKLVEAADRRRHVDGVALVALVRADTTRLSERGCWPMAIANQEEDVA